MDAIATRGQSSDEPLVRALYYLTYLTGGPWHIVTLGLLLAGMSVPGLMLRLVPRQVAITGLVIAAVAELTTLVLIWPELSPLLPLARITGLIWLIVAGTLLPPGSAEPNGHNRTATSATDRHS